MVCHAVTTSCLCTLLSCSACCSCMPVHITLYSLQVHCTAPQLLMLSEASCHARCGRDNILRERVRTTFMKFVLLHCTCSFGSESVIRDCLASTWSLSSKCTWFWMCSTMLHCQASACPASHDHLICLLMQSHYSVALVYW